MPHNVWDDILQQPCEFTGDGGLRFAGAHQDPASRIARPFACPLPDLGFLAIAGPDAARFLQGQLSCDIGEVSPRHWTPGCHCTPKGRVIASFQLARSGDEAFLLGLPAGMIDIVQRSLSRYVVFSKADLVDASRDWLAVGLGGPAAADVIRQFFDGVPGAPHEQVSMPAGLCLRVADAQPRFAVWLRTEHATAFWQAADQALGAADTEVWDLLNIRAGLASVRPETTEMFIPQMLNYDVIGAVSFKKGCYTGQEVVARAHYRGAVKRHLRHFTGPGEACPPPGAVVYAQGQAVGHVVASSRATGASVEGLLVAQDGSGDLLSLTPGGDHPTLTSFAVARGRE